MGGVVGGVVLIIIGAIMSFGVKDNISGVDLSTIGYIVMLGGLVIGIVGAIFAFRGRTATTTNHTVVDPANGERIDQVKHSSTL